MPSRLTTILAISIILTTLALYLIMRQANSDQSVLPVEAQEPPPCATLRAIGGHCDYPIP